MYVLRIFARLSGRYSKDHLRSERLLFTPRTHRSQDDFPISHLIESIEAPSRWTSAGRVHSDFLPPPCGGAGGTCGSCHAGQRPSQVLQGLSVRGQATCPTLAVRCRRPCVQVGQFLARNHNDRSASFCTGIAEGASSEGAMLARGTPTWRCQLIVRREPSCRRMILAKVGKFIVGIAMRPELRPHLRKGNWQTCCESESREW
ncbi:hypothetical protein LXA43DRAFT_982052 [Ganoderma leucocontextum]|nr:hypothetical protein LXA43DRAFT_982052 [Ganoderma leucocontextum]